MIHDRQLEYPHLFGQARLPSFPHWTRVEAGELGDWWWGLGVGVYR